MKQKPYHTSINIHEHKRSRIRAPPGRAATATSPPRPWASYSSSPSPGDVGGPSGAAGRLPLTAPSPSGATPTPRVPLTFNNSALIERLVPRGASASRFDPCRFVVETTGAVWNTRDDVSAALRWYFAKD